MANRVSSYFSKRWPLSNRTRTKHNINTHKVKRHRNLTPKTGRREPQQNCRLGTITRGPKLDLRAQPQPQFLKRYKTFG